MLKTLTRLSYEKTTNICQWFNTDNERCCVVISQQNSLTVLHVGSKNALKIWPRIKKCSTVPNEVSKKNVVVKTKRIFFKTLPAGELHMRLQSGFCLIKKHCIAAKFRNCFLMQKKCKGVLLGYCHSHMRRTQISGQTPKACVFYRNLHLFVTEQNFVSLLKMNLK